MFNILRHRIASHSVFLLNLFGDSEKYSLKPRVILIFVILIFMRLNFYQYSVYLHFSCISNNFSKNGIHNTFEGEKKKEPTVSQVILRSLTKQDTVVYREHAFSIFLKNLISGHFRQFSSSNFTEYLPAESKECD